MIVNCIGKFDGNDADFEKLINVNLRPSWYIIKIISNGGFTRKSVFEKLRNETIIYTFVLTGIRLQELINLQIYDVNLECGEIMVRQGKGNKDRKK